MKKYVEALRLYEELYQKEPGNLNYRLIGFSYRKTRCYNLRVEY
ncbi:hypothetical protein [Aeribacillus sp. FSL M8-0254]